MTEKDMVTALLQDLYDRADNGLMVKTNGNWIPAGTKQYRDEMKEFALLLAGVLGIQVVDYENMEEA